MKKHTYALTAEWTGNEGSGTLNYRSYSRAHTITMDGKSHQLFASADPTYLGDSTKFNPEDLLLSALAGCHMLSYLYLCSANNIVVTHYVDNATGTMETYLDGSGKFVEVTLHPIVTISSGDAEKALELHHAANTICYIANSCNFPIKHEATIEKK